MKTLSALVLFLSLWRVSWQRSTPADDSYVAAVLEYNFIRNTTANVENYVRYIRDAAAQGADIVVFPELTLLNGELMEIPIHGRIRQFPIPAATPNLYDPILVSLSAAAAEYQIYVVFNIPEICHCGDPDSGEFCPEARDYYFNTNVVLDRDGAVIDRYRKINLFGEFSRSPALNPDLGIFTTDFGVTFGHFICFDLLFQVPAIQVVQKYNISDVIFPTMWFSELPYLTAVQIQEGYAFAANVNFLASGANNVGIGSAGSGIFSGKAGALISTMPGVPTTRLLVARVPKVPGAITASPGPIVDPPGEADSLFLKIDPSLTAHVSRLLVPGSQEFTLTHNEVSCRFRVRLDYRSDVNRTFRAFVHDGSNVYARRQLGVASCSVVACRSQCIKSCPYKYNDTEAAVSVEAIAIEMTSYREQYNLTLKCANVVYLPDTLQTNKFPLSTSNFTFSSRNVKGRQKVHMSLDSEQEKLLTFGIWGRIFTKDVDHEHQITAQDLRDELDFDEYVWSNHYEYRATAFDGIRTYDGFASGGSRVCSVVACTGPGLETCGSRFEAYAENLTAAFEELFIEATVPTPLYDADLEAFDSTFHLLSADVSTLPLKPDEYSYTEETNYYRTVFTLNLERFDKEFYSLAIWGRVYATDGQEPTPPYAEADIGTEPLEVDVGPNVEESSPGSASAITFAYGVLLTAVARWFL